MSNLEEQEEQGVNFIKRNKKEQGQDIGAISFTEKDLNTNLVVLWTFFLFPFIKVIGSNFSIQFFTKQSDYVFITLVNSILMFFALVIIPMLLITNRLSKLNKIGGIELKEKFKQIPILLFGKTRSERSERDELHQSKTTSLIQNIVISIICFFLVYLIANSTEQTEKFVKVMWGDTSIGSMLLRMNTTNESLVRNVFLSLNSSSATIFLAIIPAFIEEFFFRGVIYYEIRYAIQARLFFTNKKNFDRQGEEKRTILNESETSELVRKKKIEKSANRIFIIMSGIMFGFAHLNLLFLLHYSLIGMLLAYTYLKTKNLWIPTIFHFLVNYSAIRFFLE